MAVPILIEYFSLVAYKEHIRKKFPPHNSLILVLYKHILLAFNPYECDLFDDYLCYFIQYLGCDC